MDDDKVDLSALDPSLDAPRWDRMVTSLAERAVEQRRRRLTVTYQLAQWARPALAIAAGLALISWWGAWAKSTPRTTQAEQPATVLLRWAAKNEHPSAAQMLDVLGGRDGN